MPAPSQLQHWQTTALAHQGLVHEPAFDAGLAGTLQAIEHLGYVQIDTLSVVERAHHHVLWSRVPDYDLTHLNQLTSTGQIFEYWFHAASYLPMRDYRFTLARMETFRRGESSYLKNVDARLMAEILARAKGEGILRTRDLKENRQGQGVWWNHGPGRRALDKLFMQGDLMIRERKGMEKIYVPPEQLLPKGIDLTPPSADEMAQYLLENAMRAHGVFTWGQLMHLRSSPPLRNAMRELLQHRLEQGELMRLPPEHPDTYIVSASQQATLAGASSTKVQLLSPFDNAVIHRERLQQLFDFHYRLECYVPAAKRVYGYFCLPVLWQGRFVGRIDCKAVRAQQRFMVLSQHLDPKLAAHKRFQSGLRQALDELAVFCGCQPLA